MNFPVQEPKAGFMFNNLIFLSGMSKRKNVRLLKRSQIDVVKWDETVRGHSVHFVYGYSWYLDAQGEWEALVYGDYEVVLPLPKKRKFVFTFYYNPWFCQQLGFFGAGLTHRLTEESIIFSGVDELKAVDIF